MATGPYLFAERIYALLPAVFRRFDTAGDRPARLLRRFLDLVGGELDQIYSTVRSLPGLTDVHTVDGRLLPLLAHWVGWRVDHGLPLDEQRRQILDAPAVYQAVQTVGALEAAARRVTGWPCTAKELVDNVAVTNRPERLNLWLWPLTDPPPKEPVLLSTDEAGEGRPAVVRHPDGTLRLVYATTAYGTSEIREKIRATDGSWSPDTAVVTGPDTYCEPAAARLGDTVLLLWNAYARKTGWRIEFRRLENGVWGPVQSWPGPGSQRRDPAVAVEEVPGALVLWLFWRESDDGERWRLRYQRRTGPVFAPASDGVRDFPAEPGGDPRVDAGVSVALRAGQIWVWWARRTSVGPGRTAWRVAFRVKATTADDAAGWDAVTELAAGAGQHDREPSGSVDGGGRITVVFSSTRDGGWSVWQAGIDAQARTWGQPAAVTDAVFTERSPVTIPHGEDATGVVHRSSRSITYPGTRHRAAVTVDRRYSGSVTVRATDRTKLDLRGTVDDVLAYTCSARVTGEQIVREGGGAVPIAADVVRLYLDAPAGADPATVDATLDRLTAVLRDYLPITARATLVLRRSPA